MTALSAFLMIVERREQPALRKMGTGYEVPARVINYLVNGPGLYVGRLIPMPTPDALHGVLSYEADRLLGVAAFWFLIGLSIDRRRSKQRLDQSYPIAAGALFMALALICGTLAFGAITPIFCPGTTRAPCLNRYSVGTILANPLRTQDTIKVGGAVWFSALCLYFLRRAFITARTSLTKTA